MCAACCLLSLKCKDHYSIDPSDDIHIAIHRYVYQLMGVFCDRLGLSFVLQQLATAGLAKTKADIANKAAHSCLSCCAVSSYQCCALHAEDKLLYI